MWMDFHTRGVRFFSQKSWLVAASTNRIRNATKPRISKGKRLMEA